MILIILNHVQLISLYLGYLVLILILWWVLKHRGTRHCFSFKMLTWLFLVALIELIKQYLSCVFIVLDQLMDKYLSNHFLYLDKFIGANTTIANFWELILENCFLRLVMFVVLILDHIQISLHRIMWAVKFLNHVSMLRMLRKSTPHADVYLIFHAKMGNWSITMIIAKNWKLPSSCGSLL